MKITWVTRSFLDYRIPVYKALNELSGDQLTVIYFADVVPISCQRKLKNVLGERAIGLTGETRIGGKKEENQAFANTGGLRITLRPGLIRKVKNTKPDIILSDGFFQWTYAALFLNFMLGIPHIMCYERTSYTERNVSFIKRTARKIASKFISAICCNGIQTQEYLEQFGYPKDRLFLGNMAADSKGLLEAINKIQPEEIDTLKEKYDILGDVFLYVGQLIPRKGIMEMLAAWKVFESSNKDITLVLLGDGELYEEATRFSDANNIKSIRLLGKVEYSEVASFYAIANIFLVGTLEDNWSLVVPEAMSCALPVICSKYNGCWPELIKPDNGWVFDPLNSEEYVHTLQDARDNVKNWESMGKSSMQIIKNFTPNKVGRRIFKVCEKEVLKQ